MSHDVVNSVSNNDSISFKEYHDKIKRSYNFTNVTQVL